MWLGPAPKRPFNRNRFHFTFRWFWDYAGGLMTDWGVHLLDYALYGMNVTAPNSITAWDLSEKTEHWLSIAVAGK